MQSRIRKWFADHDSGEFAIPHAASAYSVISAASASDCVVYTTKPRLILTRFPHDVTSAPFGLIGRYGLPNDYDVTWIQSLVAGRRLLFLGDADPPDLLIFAWLRSRLKITFQGLNDLLLDQSRVTWSDDFIVTMSGTELDAVPLLREELTDIEGLVGSRCAAMLESGRKCELEALFSFSTLTPEGILSAIHG